MELMNISLLPPERFNELPIEIDPNNSIVAVVEDPETHEIKGYWAAQQVVHMEPIWLAEDVRDGGRNALHMLAALIAGLQGFGIKNFYCFADRPEIADYLSRLGLTLSPYVLFQGQVPDLPTE